MSDPESRSGADPARLEGFIREAGLSFRATSKSFVFTCPKCRKPDKLYIRRSDGRFVCWFCAEDGFKGAPEFALRELTGQSLHDIREALYGRIIPRAAHYLNVRIKDFLEDDEEDSDIVIEEPLPDLEWPYHCYPIDDPAAARGAAYLAGRGVPVDVASEYGIRYSTTNQAVVFPCFVGEQLVGWQYRTVLPLKYKTAAGTIKERLKVWTGPTDEDGGVSEIPWRDRVLMFQNCIKDVAVLCEGPVDAIKARLVGGGVAAMGKVVSEGQLRVLLRSGIRKLYVALDPDAATELEGVARRVSGADVEVFHVKLPERNDGKKPDLGELSFEEAKEVILSSKPFEYGKLHIFLNPKHLAPRRPMV